MMTSRRRLATASAAIALALPAAAASPATAAHQPKLPAATAQQPVPDITDADFLAQAAQGNRFEIASGQLAKRRARSPIVRALAKEFVRHHKQALAEGTAVAAKLGIAPPAGVNPKQQATLDTLARLDGRRFDRAWLKAQLAAHVESVALHLRGALNGDTQDVRTLAILALPVVSQHLGQLTVAARAKRHH
jgi:putative membrane protein